MSEKLPIGEWSVYPVGTPDGLLRLAIDDGSDEPPFLPGAARAHGGPFWPVSSAVVEAVPTTRSDGQGMYWTSKTEAAQAERAAREAIEAEREEGAK